MDPKKYQLIILSGGRALNVRDNTDEIELIQNTATPIIGICYGFQIICYSYGAKFFKLSKKREGTIEINNISNHPIFNNEKSFIACQNHRFAVRKIPDDLVCLASSEDGCEVVQVKGKQQFGLQFHPEIVTSLNEGKEIFNNLLKYIFKTQAD